MEKVINITGGIGTGKSSVANFIEDMGYDVVRSDQVAKDLMNSDEKMITKLKDVFGEDFYKDGKVNNEFVASQVFGNDDKSKKRLAKLNSIVHPAVIDHNMNSIDKLFETGKEMVFVESALTFEIGMEDAYDYIVVVDTPDDIRIPRVMKRNSLSEEEVLKRINNQMNMVEKRKYADFVIDNKGSLEELKNSTKFIVELLEKMPPKQVGG